MGHSWKLNYHFFPSFLHNWTVHKPASSQEIKCGNRCGLQLVYTPKSCLSELSRQQWDTGTERWWRLWGTMEGLCLNLSFFLRCVCVCIDARVHTYVVCAQVCVQTLQGPSALARSQNCRWERRLSSVRSFVEAVSNQNEFNFKLWLSLKSWVLSERQDKTASLTLLFFFFFWKLRHIRADMHWCGNLCLFKVFKEIQVLVILSALSPK